MSDAQVILDTNIVSYLMRGGKEAQRYLPHAVPLITHNAAHFAGIEGLSLVTESPNRK
jgi:hypothetical protein